MPLFWIGTIFCLIVTMIINPQEIFSASLYGLKIWWDIVFPSLLPFFIFANLFMGLGAVKILGALVEPLMRPLFNLPGESALVVAIGYTSGFPIGASFTAKLRKENIISQFEAERLLSFTNNSSPLFMFVAISVGMLGLPDTGIIIAVSHYLANIIVGLIYRFHGRTEIVIKTKQGYLEKLKCAIKEVSTNKTKPIGYLLGDAVKNAMQSLTSIGGYIILFAVLLKSFELVGIISALQNFIALFMPIKEIQLQTAVAKGIFEMTIGCKTTAEALVSLESKLIFISIILAWSGLSIHAQVLSQINDTDIRYLPFLVARIIHAAFAGILCKLFYEYKLFSLPKAVSLNLLPTTNKLVLVEWQAFFYILFFLVMLSFFINFTRLLCSFASRHF